MARCRYSCNMGRRAIGTVLMLLLAGCGTVSQQSSANKAPSSSSTTLSSKAPVTTTTQIQSLPGRPAFDPQSVPLSLLRWVGRGVLDRRQLRSDPDPDC